MWLCFSTDGQLLAPLADLFSGHIGLGDWGLGFRIYSGWKVLPDLGTSPQYCIYFQGVNVVFGYNSGKTCELHPLGVKQQHYSQNPSCNVAA